MRDFLHELTGTVIADRGNGRIVIDLRYAPDDAVFLSQAAWFVETVERIAREAAGPIDFLFDLSHFEPSIWNALMRERCRQMLEESTIARRIAIVGDAITFGIVYVTLESLRENKEKVKFCFSIPEAKTWLGW